eukprot:7421881-Lingulodinium_polyedra.AAC.1
MVYQEIQYGMASTQDIERAGPGWERCMDQQQQRLRSAKETLIRCVETLSPRSRRKLAHDGGSPHQEIPVPD